MNFYSKNLTSAEDRFAQLGGMSTIKNWRKLFTFEYDTRTHYLENSAVQLAHTRGRFRMKMV
jgi:hypothetical protein